MLKQKVRWLIGGAVLGLLAACGGGAAALSASEAARLLAVETAVQMIPGLRQQITDLAAAQMRLQTQVTALASGPRPTIFVTAPRSTAVRAMEARRAATPGARSAAKAGEAACTGLGTLTGQPDTSNPVSSGLIGAISCTGYRYVVSDAVSADEEGLIQPVPPDATVWATADCTGQAYVRRTQGSGLSAGVFAQGAVFSVRDPADGTTTGYVAVYPNTPRVTIPFGSFRDRFNRCQAFAGDVTIDNAMPLLPNDEAITGVPSSPITGPILITTGLPATPPVP